MRSFLLKDGSPTIKWGNIPVNACYKGTIPKGYDLAINPHEPYVIVDVDRHGKIDGFDNIPEHLLDELNTTLSYPTKNNGRHYWFYYTGEEVLANKASGQGIDLRIGYTVEDGEVTHNGGYVKWHPRDKYKLEDYLWGAQPTSKAMNNWLKELFGFNCIHKL